MLANSPILAERASSERVALGGAAPPFKPSFSDSPLTGGLLVNGQCV
jgi:hypothetical protein